MEFLELDAQVRSLLAEGRRVGAVKLVREAMGWGLKRSKDYVDDLEESASAAKADELGVKEVSDLVAEVRVLVALGHKVRAVKHVREATGWGLKRAKDYVDALGS